MGRVEKRGFSWMGLLFGPSYYAGYGNMKKAVIMALLSFMPLTGLIVNVHCGLKANAELPVKEQAFQWKNVAIIAGILILMLVIEEGVFGLYSRGM